VLASAAPTLGSSPSHGNLPYRGRNVPLQNPFKIKVDISTDDEKWTIFSNALLVVDHESLKGLLSSLKDIVDITEMSNNVDDKEVLANLVRGLAKDLVIASLNGGMLREDAVVRVQQQVLRSSQSVHMLIFHLVVSICLKMLLLA
jgi:hypothetical protein